MPIRRTALEAGERVLVHAPAARDRAEFLALVRESRALHRGWVSPPDDDAGFEAYCRRARTDRHAGFLVRRAEDGALVGMVNVNEIVRGAFLSAYLGYHAFAPLAGSGRFRAGFGLALDAVFHDLGLHRVEANIQPTNLRSRALVESFGFRLEGFSPRYLHIDGAWRDHERWALLADEWAGRSGTS